MFKWLGRKVEIAGIQAASTDLDRFIAGLRGASDAEVGFMVAMATLLRLRMQEAGELPRFALDLSLPRDQKQADLLQWKLNRTVNGFQKLGQPTDAAASMVWLHSVRALNMPELRSQGRTMWSQLTRGFPTSVESAQEICQLMGLGLPERISSEVTFIPVGLEPREA